MVEAAPRVRTFGPDDDPARFDDAPLDDSPASAIGPPSTPDPALRPVVAFLTGSASAFDAIPWSALRRQDLLAVRFWIIEAFSGFAAQRLLTSLRQVLAQASENRAPVVPRSFFRFRTALSPRGPTQRRLWGFIEACDDGSTEGVRDRALASLIAFASVRPTEVARLRPDDFDDQLSALHVGKSARVPVARAISLSGEANAAMHAWSEIRGSAPGPLFALSVRDHPTSLSRPLRNRAVRPADLRAAYLTALRSEYRRDPFLPLARFGFGEDGEAQVLVSSLEVSPPDTSRD